MLMAFSHGVKRLEHDTQYSLPSGTEVRSVCVELLSVNIFMAW